MAAPVAVTTAAHTTAALIMVVTPVVIPAVFMAAPVRPEAADSAIDPRAEAAALAACFRFWELPRWWQASCCCCSDLKSLKAGKPRLPSLAYCTDSD